MDTTSTPEPFAPDAPELAETRPLTPEARAWEPGATVGAKLAIGDHTWLLPLAMTSADLDPFRNEMIRQCAFKGTYSADLLRDAGQLLLMMGYDLRANEAYYLIRSAPLDPLRDALEEALLAYSDNREVGYHDWVRSSLIANGIAPELVDDADLPHVLNQLLATGRAVPPDKFLGVAIEGAQFQAIKNMAVPAPAQPPAEVPAP